MHAASAGEFAQFKPILRNINRIKYSSILDIRKDLKVDYLLKGRIIKNHNQINKHNQIPINND